MATSNPISSHKAAEPAAVGSDHNVLLHELAALRRSEAVLRDFIETSTIGLHWVGADGTILWANQAELELLGYEREQYVGRNIAEFHADEPVINDMLARLSRGETLRDHPARLRHRNGSIRHVLVNSSVLFEDGKFVHTRCFTRDVTALRYEQEANRLLAAIVDRSDDAIISEDLTGRITTWNRGAERIFGYTAQEAIGQSTMMLIPEDRQEEEVQILGRLQRGEPVDHFETLRRCKDGKLLNISLTTSPVRDRQGEIIGGSKIARDITESKRNEEAIKSLNRQQAADLAAMTRMQEFSTRLIQPGAAFSDVLNEIVEAGIAITKADMGDIRLGGADGEMTIAAQRGFKPPFLEFFGKGHGGPLTYASALQHGERVIMEDIASSPLIVGPTVASLLDAGARSLQSTPLVSRSGQVLGVFSTYYRLPCGPTERDLRLIDVLVRLAADLIERSRAEEKVRESEERLRFAQDTANIGTFDWNIATGQNTWTTKLERMYGLTPGGFLGTQPAWEALVHPVDRPRALQRVTESLETGAPMEDEWRVIWPDGSIHWLAGRWRVLKNAEGKPVRMMGVHIDVTDRKHMEEALRESEERFRLATKATNDAIWDIDLRTGTVSWNDTYSTLYGRPPDTSDSWQWWIDNIHPEDRERTVGDLRAAIASSGASIWICEYRFRRLDGEWAYIYDRAYIARDASGNAWRVIGAMQDLTERKQAEAALRESEERFRRVFEEGPLGLALVGRDYHFLKVNGALCQMLGYPEAELVRMSFTDITHPDDLQADVELAERLFRREIPFYRVQKRYVKKTGEIIWINLTATLILDHNGETLQGLGMIENITEVKRAQEEALARQKLESMGTLASGIAHDFNNLLGGVQAQAELAIAELDAGSSRGEELKAICELTKRGSEIVRQLMIYAGKETEVVERVDLSKIVEEMLALLKVSVSKHALMDADLAQDLPPTRAGAAQLRQIVMNLITNASDAIGDRDGLIRVSTRRVGLSGQSATDLQALSNGDYVALEVSDTGCGMSRETQTRLFDPFFTTKSAGRGLGLAVVSGIVRSLGGAVRVTSEPGKGSTFQILLPCAETSIGATGYAISNIEEPEGPLRQTAVLIVEDEDVLRQAVAKTLRKNGFEVFQAADGSSAIHLLRVNQGKIDVILLDMTIPGASSQEVVAEAANFRPDIRVILTSAYGQETFSGARRAPQIRHFIRKPFQLADLVKIIRRSLVS